MMQMLAIDLAKQWFHVHEITDDGELILRWVGRSKLLDLVARLAPAVITIEVCVTAHF